MAFIGKVSFQIILDEFDCLHFASPVISLSSGSVSPILDFLPHSYSDWGAIVNVISKPKDFVWETKKNLQIERQVGHSSLQPGRTVYLHNIGVLLRTSLSYLL